MKKKSFLLGFILLATGQLFAQEMQFATRSFDGAITDYQALANLQKIVFEDNAMAVKLQSGTKVTSVRSVIFSSEGTNALETQKQGSTITVFPNLAKTTITVSGMNENTMIKLFDVNGLLLQRAMATGTSTELDVSSLKQGLYLIQAGNQTVKFIKQ